MTDSLLIALGLALLSALALNAGFYSQHRAASGLPPLSIRRPVHALATLFSTPRWLMGFLVGVAGWVAYVAALRFGPLSLVQAVSAGGVGVLALLAWSGGQASLGRREWWGVAAAMAGLALLGASLSGAAGRTRPHGASLSEVALWIGISGALAALVAGPVAARLAGGAGLGMASGMLYAAGDVATKAALSGGGRGALFVPVLLACHGLGFVCLQLGFQRGGVLATAGVSTVLTNAVPIAAAIVLFHDPIPGGPLGVVRVAGFAAVVASATLLAARPQDVTTVSPAPSVSTLQGWDNRRP